MYKLHEKVTEKDWYIFVPMFYKDNYGREQQIYKLKNMNELIINREDGKCVTTSVIVAREFGKRNSDVLRDIRNLSCSRDFRERNFALMVKINELPQGGAQKSEYYEMTKDGFSFLVIGYTGEKAAQFKERFLNAFNGMQELLNSDDYILARSQTILKNRISAQEQRIANYQNRQSYSQSSYRKLHQRFNMLILP